MKLTRLQTCLSLAQRDVRQQVMASDDAEQLKNMPEVCLVTSPLTLQREQEIPPAPYPSSLVLVNNVHKKERTAHVHHGASAARPQYQTCGEESKAHMRHPQPPPATAPPGRTQVSETRRNYCRTPEPIGIERVQESHHELLWMRTLQPSLSEERKARSGNMSLSGNEKCVACPDLMKSSVARGGQDWHSHAAVRSSLFTRRMTGEGMAEGPVSSVKQLQLCQTHLARDSHLQLHSRRE